MADLPIHFRCERAFHDELMQRVAVLPWLKSQDNPTAEPPYAIIQCDEARETTPESGVFYVEMAILVTTVMVGGDGTDHARKVQAVREALEKIPRPGKDVGNEIEVLGFVVQRITPANTGQEQGSLFEVSVGCKELETSGYTPDEPMPA
jgi:hypothetical protein